MFLGSRHFTAQDSLLPLTMEHGGQANASTRERHTDYFFELPTTAVDAGLERLCDMLAAPALDLRQQHAEREVLHAEYLAWSRDDLSAASRALAEAVPAQHPLARCHAGERASLALQQEGFQQALRRFHRDFYHAGQARLVLLGPQPPEQLRELAEREGNRLRAATPTPRPPPPALLPPRHSRVAMARPVCACCLPCSNCRTAPRRRCSGSASNCSTTPPAAGPPAWPNAAWAVRYRRAWPTTTRIRHCCNSTWAASPRTAKPRCSSCCSTGWRSSPARTGAR